MSSAVTLSLKGLSKTFGSLVANDNISIDLYSGEILALLGENGAGKSTLMNMLFGHYQPDAGHVEVAAEEGVLQVLPAGQPQAAIAAGIGMVHQHFTLAENMNALDNIVLGAETLLGLSRNSRAANEKIQRLMEQSGLFVPLDVPVGKLTVGERQRVEILKALYRDVSILVLDEPTAVLTPQEADALFDNLQGMVAKGLSIIFISHKLREVLSFSHRIVVLRQGCNVGEMRTTDADEKTIAQMMVGTETEAVQRQAQTAGEPVLELNAISLAGESRRNSLSNINLVVHANEIVGIAGISGNGQTALSDVVAGVLKPTSGDMRIAGNPVTKHTPRQRIESGVGCIPEDRHRDGIVGDMSAAENIVLDNLHDGSLKSFGLLKKRSIKALSTRLINAFDVRGPGAHAPAKLMSGGNIQKLILARVFERQPKLILANQPTRGLDIGAAAEVAKQLLLARANGAGVVLISEDLDEILNLSDRIVVMHDGVLIETTSRDRAALGLMMAGQAA